jgi:hypothetical protein
MDFDEILQANSGICQELTCQISLKSKACSGTNKYLYKNWSEIPKFSVTFLDYSEDLVGFSRNFATR